MFVVIFRARVRHTDNDYSQVAEMTRDYRFAV